MSQKYQFPIKKPGANGGTATDYTYDEIMDALDDSGHYLLGKNNRWHGGVHYAQSFSDDVTQREPVYAIGKGTIVAYRLKKEESILQAFDPIQETKYDYSTSFVLIKHELRVEIEPANTEENASVVLGNQLNERWSNQEVTLQGNGQQIYHSADLNTYNRDPLTEDTTITLTGVDPVLVDFGDHQSYVIRGRRADGTDVWLEGFDNNGNVLETEGTASLTPNNPDAVNTPPAEDTNNEGTKLLTFYSLYMHLAHYEEYTATQKKVKTAVANMRTRQYDSATKVVDETEAGVIRRNIPKGEIITIIDTVDINEDGSYIVGKISDTEIIVIKKSNKFYATIEQKGLSRPAYWPEGNTPPTLNAVIACEIPVEKGALIGHLGIFETPTSAIGGKNKKHQVHIEIFTEDNAEFEKFYRNDRNLFQDQKYIRLRNGYTISSQMSETASDTNTLHTVLGEHVLKLDTSDVVTNSDNVEYYRLLNIPNNVFANNPITTGYIRKDSLRGTGVFCQHDWDQLGFTLVKENNDNADGFIDVPETPEFFQEIYQTITETTLPDENDQPVRGTDEFKLAALKFRLNDKLFRDRWSKIIAKHPTEWEVDGENDRWQLLKDIFETVKNKSNIEKHERERITNLVFWDDLGEKPSQTNLLHFHPMAFINNLHTSPPCYCNRDFTVDEISNIINELRLSENIQTRDLFNDRRAINMGVSLSNDERTFDALTIQINNVFREFNINTCLRKIHFLAQANLETDRFRSPVEYGGNLARYNPYYGRGLLHLTHSDAYERYQSFSGIDCFDSPNLIMNSLYQICRSGAWFWRRGKVVTGNSRTMMWTASRDRGGRSYQMEVNDYIGIPSGRPRQYRSVDLNLIADDDDINLLNWLVNGGTNGHNERIRYRDTLKIIFDYENKCINFNR